MNINDLPFKTLNIAVAVLRKSAAEDKDIPVSMDFTFIINNHDSNEPTKITDLSRYPLITSDQLLTATAIIPYWWRVSGTSKWSPRQLYVSSDRLREVYANELPLLTNISSLLLLGACGDAELEEYFVKQIEEGDLGNINQSIIEVHMEYIRIGLTEHTNQQILKEFPDLEMFVHAKANESDGTQTREP